MIISGIIIALTLLSLTAVLILSHNLRIAARDAAYARHIGYTARSKSDRAYTPKTGFGRWVTLQLTQAGIDVPLGTAMASVATICMAAGLLLSSFIGITGAALGAAVTAGCIVIILKALATNRAKSFAKQFAATLPMVAQNLRAGATIETAFSNVTQFTTTPLKTELERVSAEMRYGRIPVDEAITHMAKRTGDKDVDFLATAIGVQKIGGGDLATLLDSCAEKINAKQILHGRIDSVTSQARYTSKIIAVVPFVLLGFVLLAAPDIAADFWASPFYPFVIAALVVLDVAALIIIRRIYAMPVE